MIRAHLRLILLAAALTALAAVYFIFDPVQTVWMPKCIMHTLTGLDCPGCGAQRAVHAMLHGHLADAFRANAFIVVLFPYLALMLVAEIYRNRLPRLYKAICSGWALWTLFALIIAWGVLRNIIF